KVLSIKFSDGQDAHPTREKTFCGTGKMPVPAIFARGLLTNLRFCVAGYNGFQILNGEGRSFCDRTWAI
ncbi:hypothetical protein, partial [Microcoleus sp. BROC3]|uniref:hypothetical protein n=1 Tax=Microcoleus sp. BROC3 TaxID=3055323 RepID=UPI002FD22284